MIMVGVKLETHLLRRHFYGCFQLLLYLARVSSYSFFTFSNIFMSVGLSVYIIASHRVVMIIKMYFFIA